MYIVRMLIPPILMLVLFFIDIQNDTPVGLPIQPDRRMLDYKLPSCFYLADGKENNFGSKIVVPDCISLAYYPIN